MNEIAAAVLIERRRPRRRGLLGELDRPRDLLASFGPNWFASVMGTGIVANAAALLPVGSGGLSSLALGVWILAAAMLVLVSGATVAHWLLFGESARAHHRSISMVPFYGAPPMAMLTVGSGALLVGRHLIGLNAAVRVDEVLWTLGTLTGLLSSVAVPYLLFTRLRAQLDETFGSWLMPIVPPMVSAATGAGLIAHLPAGQDRLGLLVGCYAMFGIGLLMSLNVIALLWHRLVRHGVGPARMVPTLWIVLGPLGQSVTAAGLLGHAALVSTSLPYRSAFDAMALLYGLPVWGFAISWMVIAAAITIRALRRELPFALTWWSFTFPVGTVVTGTCELAAHLHAGFLTAASIGLYGLLVAAWLIVLTRTVHGGARGTLFLPAGPARPSPDHLSDHNLSTPVDLAEWCAGGAE